MHNGRRMETSPKETHPLYLAVFSFTVAATVIVAALLDRCPYGCSGLLEVIEVGTSKGVLYGTFLVSAMEVIRIMIILPSDYLRHKYIEPLKQEREKERQRRKELERKRIDEGIARGLTRGLTQGRAQGRSQMHAEILEWMREKEEADREGKPFDKPMPGAERNGSSPNSNGSAPKR